MKSYSAWRPLQETDAVTLREYYGIETEGRDLVRRDVTIMMLFVFPATGYPEWGERSPDGHIKPLQKKDLAKRVPDHSDVPPEVHP